MKGVVFTNFLEMVEQKWSPDFADQLIESTDLPSRGIYTAVGTYPHTEMVSLVVRLSEMSGITVPDLLRAYGEYLFGQFVRLYPVFFQGVSSAMDFVASIDAVIHVEVRKLYPDAELPKFVVEERTPNLLRIRYVSERHLADLAEGLLAGCIAHFGESQTIRLERHDLPQTGSPVCFSLKRI